MQVPAIENFLVAPMALADAADWAEYVLLPEVMQFTSSSANSIDDLIPIIERTLSREMNAPIMFAIRDRHRGTLVASVGFHTVSALNRTAEITYTVRPEFWGRGVATAACAAAVSWAFENRRWVRVQATTLPDHLASQRVLIRCGFLLEGTVRNFRMVRGQPRDYLMYSNVASDSPTTASLDTYAPQGHHPVG